MAAIEFRGVSKSYSVYEAAGDRLKELLTLNRLQFHRDFWALRDVSFEVNRGETFCIVGENGSGKSTLLQIVAGILQPTSGIVKVNGRISALLELGSGFNPEFSGRDNVYMQGAILGLSNKEMDKKYQEILDFAEIGDFIRQPVKTYSSGMSVRLAFSVAIHVDPDILLVDEALAVGDIYFRQRCMRKVHELRARGVTVLFVSHATGDVKALGDKAMWLDRGVVRDLGDTERVVNGYLAAMTSKDSAYIEHRKTEMDRTRPVEIAPEVEDHIPNIDHRHGDGRAEILGISVNDPGGNPVRMLDPGTKIVVRISARAKDEIHHPNVGFMFRNHLGIDFSGTNTTREGHELSPMLPGDVVTVDFHIDLPELSSSTFSFSPAIADGSIDAYKICDWIENAIALPMTRGENPVYGQMHMKCRVEINSRLGVPAPLGVVD